jgi:hypothetical protein
MKTAIAIVTIVCIGLVICVVQSEAKIDLKNALGVWLLNEGKGKTVTDMSGNGNDGDIQGAKWEKGKVGPALSFNGSTDRVVIPDADSLFAPKTWTITSWIYVNKSEVGYGHILGKRSGAGTNYAFRTSSTGTGWESYFRKDNAWKGAWQQGAVKKDTWLFMAAVYDGKNEITIYENGDKIGSAVVGAPPPQDTSEVHIAGWQGNTSELLDGLLSEVALFDIALSQADVKDLMEKGTERVLGIKPVDALGKLAATWGSIKKQ